MKYNRGDNREKYQTRLGGGGRSSLREPRPTRLQTWHNLPLHACTASLNQLISLQGIMRISIVEKCSFEYAPYNPRPPACAGSAWFSPWGQMAQYQYECPRKDKTKCGRGTKTQVHPIKPSCLEIRLFDVSDISEPRLHLPESGRILKPSSLARQPPDCKLPRGLRCSVCPSLRSLRVRDTCNSSNRT